MFVVAATQCRAAQKAKNSGEEQLNRVSHVHRTPLGQQPLSGLRRQMSQAAAPLTCVICSDLAQPLVDVKLGGGPSHPWRVIANL